MKENKEIMQALLTFRNERDWEQFHNSKDLALALRLSLMFSLSLLLAIKAYDWIWIGHMESVLISDIFTAV